MTEIIEKAKELGALLQASEQVQKYTAARTAYNEDEAIQKLVREWNLHRLTLNTLSNAENPDQDRIAEAERRANAVYEQVMSNPLTQRMQQTGKAVEELLAQVNGVLTFYVTGEESSGCSHDCASCGGCH